jgi:hypothetical protein
MGTSVRPVRVRRTVERQLDTQSRFVCFALDAGTGGTPEEAAAVLYNVLASLQESGATAEDLESMNDFVGRSLAEYCTIEDLAAINEARDNRGG